MTQTATTVRFIWNHPANRHRRLRQLARAFSYQVQARAFHRRVQARGGRIWERQDVGGEFGWSSGGSATGPGSSGSSRGSGRTYGASPGHIAAPATMVSLGQSGSLLAWAGLAGLAYLVLAGGFFFTLHSRRSGTTAG